MVTDAQRKQIKKRMKRIKQAKDDGKDEEIIRKRTKELIVYLERQGLTDVF